MSGRIHLHRLESLVQSRGQEDEEALATLLQGGPIDTDLKPWLDALCSAATLASKAGKARSLRLLLDHLASSGSDSAAFRGSDLFREDEPVSNTVLGSQDAANGNTALHHAALRGSLETVELLLERGARVDVVNKHGATPLHKLASIPPSQDSPRLLQLFLDSPGCDPLLRDRHGDTPFSRLLRHGSLDSLRVLISHPSAADSLSLSKCPLILHRAVSAPASPDALSLLIGFLSPHSIDALVDPITGDTPFLLSASLLDSSSTDPSSSPPSGSASSSSPSISFSSTSAFSSSPRGPVAAVLLTAGASLLFRNPLSGGSCLHRSDLDPDFLAFLASDHPQPLQQLLALPNNAALLPLDVALLRQDPARLQVVASLLRLSAPAAPASLASRGLAFLRHFAAQHQYADCALLLLAAGVREHDCTSAESALLSAIAADVCEVVDAFFVQRLVPDAALLSPELPLAAASAFSIHSLALLSTHAPASLVAARGPLLALRNDDDESLLHAAVATDRPELVRFLISELGFPVDLCPDQFHAFSDGGTPLHLAAQKGLGQSIAVLLELGADINSRKNVGSNTPCHLAVAYGHSAAVELLLSAHPDLSLINADEESIAELAAQSCPSVVPLIRSALSLAPSLS